MHGAGLRATVSYAGRVARPAQQPVAQRVGGFGGVAGLVRYLQAEGVTHLVDATHPFAARMSANAVAAAQAAGVPLCALTRPAWEMQAGDRWQRVGSIEDAATALEGPARRVMLAVGRMHLPVFARNPQHFYLLRLVDPPDGPTGFADCAVIVSRGPFDVAGDTALMQAHGIDLVVSKNSGGGGAHAKIAAARVLGLPVLMIDRPAVPARLEASRPVEVLTWVQHGTLRGV